MKFIHLTDTHFVPPGETLYGGNPQKNLAQAVQDINEYHSDAQLVVITGDLTHWGEIASFSYLKETLELLQPPLQLLVGNHDDRQNFSACFPQQEVDANGFVQSFLDFEEGRFVFIDTIEKGTHGGNFCEHRKLWLESVLSEAENLNLPVFLFMHHPPFPVRLGGLDRISLFENQYFLASVTPFIANIRHLFFGHIHRSIAGSWKGIPISCVRGMNHQCWLDLSGNPRILGSFEPPNYAVILIEEDRVIVHFHEFQDQSQKFYLDQSPVKDWARRDSHP